jgi:hypothetical protein
MSKTITILMAIAKGATSDKKVWKMGDEVLIQKEGN